MWHTIIYNITSYLLTKSKKENKETKLQEKRKIEKKL